MTAWCAIQVIRTNSFWPEELGHIAQDSTNDLASMGPTKLTGCATVGHLTFFL